MSSLRAFRFQKTKPVTSSPSSTASDAPVLASSPGLSQSPKSSQDSSQNGNSKHSEDSEDLIKPPVSDSRTHDLSTFASFVNYKQFV